jgi:hypothetical protein
MSADWQLSRDDQSLGIDFAPESMRHDTDDDLGSARLERGEHLHPLP